MLARDLQLTPGARDFLARSADQGPPDYSQASNQGARASEQKEQVATKELSTEKLASTELVASKGASQQGG